MPLFGPYMFRIVIEFPNSLERRVDPSPESTDKVLIHSNYLCSDLVIRGNLGFEMGLIRKHANNKFCEFEFKNQ